MHSKLTELRSLQRKGERMSALNAIQTSETSLPRLSDPGPGTTLPRHQFWPDAQAKLKEFLTAPFHYQEVNHRFPHSDTGSPAMYGWYQYMRALKDTEIFTVNVSFSGIQ